MTGRILQQTKGAQVMSTRLSPSFLASLPLISVTAADAAASR
jgi:hypothetical protein